MNNVSKATQKEFDTNNNGGGRCGTLKGFTLAQFEAVFGRPHFDGNIDDKVTKQWMFNTPRGPVVVMDYWWNASDELSIGSRVGMDRRMSSKAALWARKFFNGVDGLSAS